MPKINYSGVGDPRINGVQPQRVDTAETKSAKGAVIASGLKDVSITIGAIGEKIEAHKTKAGVAAMEAFRIEQNGRLEELQATFTDPDEYRTASNKIFEEIEKSRVENLKKRPPSVSQADSDINLIWMAEQKTRAKAYARKLEVRNADADLETAAIAHGRNGNYEHMEKLIREMSISEGEKEQLIRKHTSSAMYIGVQRQMRSINNIDDAKKLRTQLDKRTSIKIGDEEYPVYENYETGSYGLTHGQRNTLAMELDAVIGRFEVDRVESIRAARDAVAKGKISQSQAKAELSEVLGGEEIDLSPQEASVIGIGENYEDLSAKVAELNTYGMFGYKGKRVDVDKLAREIANDKTLSDAEKDKLLTETMVNMTVWTGQVLRESTGDPAYDAVSTLNDMMNEHYKSLSPANKSNILGKFYKDLKTYQKAGGEIDFQSAILQSMLGKYEKEAATDTVDQAILKLYDL